MKRSVLFCFCVLFYEVNAQIVSVDSLDIGAVYKPDEAKMRKIYIENIGSDTSVIYYIYSTDYHQVFYYHGEKIQEYNSRVFKIAPKSIDSFEFNMKNLSWKQKKNYKFRIEFNYSRGDSNHKLIIPTQLSMGRKLSFLPEKINLGKIDANKTAKKEFLIKNLSKDTLSFVVSNHVKSRKIKLKPIEQKVIPLQFEYYRSSKKDLEKSKYSIYNRFYLTLDNSDGRDFDYEIPIEFSIEITDSINPKIQLDSNYLDFSCKKGQDGTRIMGVKNIGKQPLLITNCSASCGCIVPTCPREPIMPGKKTTISIKYDTNRVGPFHKSVTVMSNDPITPVVTIQVVGEIYEDN